MEEHTYRFEVDIAGSLFGFTAKDFKSIEEKMMIFASKIFGDCVKDEVKNSNLHVLKPIIDIIPKQTQVKVYDESNELVVAYLGNPL